MDSANNSANASRKKTSKKIDFSSQPIPNQIQQFSQYQQQQFFNSNKQFSQPQQLQHNFSPQHQQLQHNFSPQHQFPHPPFHSPNSYPHQPYNFPSTQSTPYMFTQPFSEYDSQSQFPHNSPENSPQHSPQKSPLIEDEANVVEAAVVPKDSSKPFTHEEDECLARAWVTGTENPKNGRDQTSQIYWNGITKLYNEEGAILGLAERQFRSLQNRLGRLKYEVQTYIEAEKIVAAKHHTGWNQVKLNDAIDTQFQKKNKKYKNLPFKCRHVLGILRNCSKYNAVTTRDNIPRISSQDTESSPTTPYIGSNGSPEQSREYHSGDKRSRCSGEEVTSPVKHPERPIGNKAAKKGSKGKGKMGEASDMSRLEGLELSAKRTNLLEESFVHRKQAHAERMKLYEEVQVMTAKNAARRLDVEEKKLEMRMQQIAADQEMRRQQIEADTEMRRQQIEMDRDMKIFNKDLNSITCPDQREATRKMQKRIMAKWNL